MQCRAITTDRSSLTFIAPRNEFSYLKKPTRVYFSNFGSFPKSRSLSGISSSQKPIVPLSVSDYEKEKQIREELKYESLSPKVRKRVKVLREMQKQYDEIEAKFIEERATLEAKYLELYQPFFSKRYEIVNGEEEKGIADFWLVVLKKNGIITKRDEGALKYLRDIKWSIIENSKGFKLEFFFDQNPYFKNTVLTKEFHVRAEFLDRSLERTYATKIYWYYGKCLTRDSESFFNIFSEGGYFERESEFKMGLTIKHKISHAVSLFTESVVLENLSPAIRKQVEVLREIEKHYDELVAKHSEEKAALEAKHYDPQSDINSE